MSRKAGPIARSPGVAVAVSRIVGSYWGLMVLWVTYVVGVLNDVHPATAALRAVACGVAVAVAGRVVGYLVGRSLALAVGGKGPEGPEEESQS